MNNRIRELRKGRKMTMKQLGEVVGLAESTISQYETGKRDPDNETLLRLSEFFDVTVGYLLGAENAEAPVDTDKRLNENAGHNIIRIAGRDGSYRERAVTDKQLAIFSALFDQLPDVPDDL